MEATDGRVLPLRAGWSGNQSIPSPDLLIPLNGTLRAIELKTSNQRRMTVTPGDIEDIRWWVENQKEVPTIAYLSVKFSYYEVYTGALPEIATNPTEAFRHWAAEAPFDTNITASGNLTIGNPSHYDVDHTSAQVSRGDGVAMLDALNEDKHSNLVSVTDVLKQSDDYWG